MQKISKSRMKLSKKIVGLRSTISSLEKELVDLKRRALQNVYQAQEDTQKEETEADFRELAKCKDASETLTFAWKKFKDFDANNSGYLDGDEILLLADWIWQFFAKDGSKVRRIDGIRAKNKLISMFDANSDGKLDFEEFSEWFLSTANELKAGTGYQKSRTSTARRTRAPRQRQTPVFDKDPSDGVDTSEPKPELTPKFPPLSSSYPPQEFTLKFPALSSPTPSASSPIYPPQVSPHTQQKGRNNMTSKRSQTEERDFRPKASRDRRASDLIRPKPGNMYKQSRKPIYDKRDMTRPAKTKTAGKEPWKCLLNFKTEARNCIQLFLRFDRTGKNFLGEKEILGILDRCQVRKRDQQYVLKTFVKKFGGENKKITLENFVDFLPPTANEKHIYVMVMDILSDIQVIYHKGYE